MSKIENSNPVKGMRDLSTQELDLRLYVLDIILKVYEKYGFSQIETPCTENINLLSNGEGGENESMLFKILKRGKKLNLENIKSESDLADLGLRYDLTVPLCRYYANNRANLPKTFKVIQTGSVWRAERPQKGRFRQFTQCDIDVIGTKSITAEIELILATSEALIQLGFKDFTVRINDRRILEALAGQCGFNQSDYSKVFIILDKLDKIGLEGVSNELEKANFEGSSTVKLLDILRQLATFPKVDIQIIRNLLPDLEQSILDDIEKVVSLVTSRSQSQYSIKIDLTLVRGMGYYTGQIFEIEAKEYSSSIAGGGRYDRMIGKYLKGNEIVPACGFSIGFERVISILENEGFKVPSEENKIVILYPTDTNDIDYLLSEADEMRKEGNIVLIEEKLKNTKYQLESLKARGFNKFAIFSENAKVQVQNLN